MIACLEMMIILVLFFIDVSDELVVYLSYALILCALLIIAAKIAKQEVGCKKGKYFPYITEIIIEKR